MTTTVLPTGTPSNGAIVASDTAFQSEIWAWLSDLLGGELHGGERIVAGTRESWSVDVRSAGATLPVIVRRGRDTLQIYGDYTREAAIYAALRDTPVPVPVIHGIRPDLRLVAAERVPGTSDLGALTPTERESSSDALMVAIARLHALDPTALDLPQMPFPSNPAECSTLDLDHWQRFHADRCAPDPVVSFALAWLRTNAPAAVRGPVLVQGDTGPGNFVAYEGGVSAVVDWELSHLGDPYEDLGWVVTRSLLFPFGDLGHRLRVYADAGGVAFDRERTWYGAIAAMIKCLIAEDAVRTGGDHDAEYPVVVSGPMFHGRLGVMALLQQSGLASEPVDLPTVAAPSGERATALSYARTVLRERLLPTLTDRVHIELTKSVLRTVRHLALADRLADALEDEERRDLQSLLRSDGDDTAEMRSALCAHLDAGALGETLDPTECLRYLDRRVQRETARSVELLGPMARTPLPTIA